MQALYILTENEYKSVESTLTIEHAKEWALSQEKYTFCIDCLELSAWDDNADYYVNRLEHHFEALLAVAPDKNFL